MGETKSVQMQNIYFGLGNEPGVLKFAPTGLGWKTPETDKVVTASSEEFKKIQWLRVARNYQLRIQLKNGNVMKFDGFIKDDYDTLKDLIRANFKLNLETKELSVKGWNWGKTEFQGSQLLFNVGNKTMFELPLNQVANTSLANKNEVGIEFMQPEQMDEDAQRKVKRHTTHELVEMRFFIPGTTLVKSGEDGETSQVDKENETEEMEERSAAAIFHDTVKELADLGQVSGDGIVLFSSVLLLTPRGRYDIEMFSSFLRLRGKTYDYKIQYTSIIKLFLLPKLDEIHTMFVIGLDPPIRQGQTRYPFLVMQFVKDEETDVVLNIDEEVLNTQYDGKLEPKYEAPTYEVVSTLFKVLSQRKVTVPNKYRSHHSVSAVKCSMKANEGYLYPLEKCFLFIPKPTTFIPNVDIDNVIFSRVSGNLSTSRTFDLRFNMKSGVDYQFSSINREEYNNLESFIQSKGIKTSNEMNDDGAISYDQLDAELGEDDDDNEVLPPRRNRGGDFKDDMDIDEDSVDEDFQDGDTDSDVEEEFDENYAGGATSSEDD